MNIRAADLNVLMQNKGDGLTEAVSPLGQKERLQSFAFLRFNCHRKRVEKKQKTDRHVMTSVEHVRKC